MAATKLHTIATIEINLGLIGAKVRVHSAVEKAQTGLRTICTGAGKHPPTPITQPITCGTCGVLDESEKEALVKGVAVGDGWKIVTKGDIATVHDGMDALKKCVSIQVHPTGQVIDATVQGEKLYYLTPDGNPKMYGLIATTIEARPDLAFMVVWVPRSTPSTYRVRVRDAVLMLEERVSLDALRPVPELEPAPADERYVSAAVSFVGTLTAPFDPATYQDTSQQRLAALLADREVVVGVPAPGVTRSVPDLGEGLLAKLEALAGVKPVPKKRTPRKKASA